MEAIGVWPREACLLQRQIHLPLRKASQTPLHTLHEPAQHRISYGLLSRQEPCSSSSSKSTQVASSMPSISAISQRSVPAATIPATYRISHVSGPLSRATAVHRGPSPSSEGITYAIEAHPESPEIVLPKTLFVPLATEPRSRPLIPSHHRRPPPRPAAAFSA